MARVVESFESERAVLNSRLSTMTHEILGKSDAEAKVSFLEVFNQNHLRNQWNPNI